MHDSGDNHWSGRITKQGRRDLRYAMVQAAHNAVDHPKWRKELARLEPRIGRNKAMVAIARKLLVVVWHVLTKEAANSASRSDPHWKKELASLEPRLGRSKAVVAIARKLLVAVWHVLTKGVKDKHAEPQRVAQSLMRFVYRTGVRHLPKGVTALQYTRQQLDRLEIGQELTHLVWGNKRFKLPSSSRASPTR